MTTALPPTKVELELTPQEVQQDVVKVLDTMQKMRMETLQDKTIPNDKKDEYLHLTYRLASGLKALALDEKTLMGKLKTVADCLDANPDFTRYDSLQDRFWYKTKPKAMQALDDVLIALAQDDFHSLDPKHHVMQAIKYLNAEGEPFEKRENVLDSIQPHQGAIPSGAERAGILPRIAGALFGQSYRAEKVDDLTLRVDCRAEDLEQIIGLVEGMGYARVQLGMTEEELRKFLAFETDKRPTLVEEPWKGVKSEGFWNGVIKYTKPLAYLVLGSLPGSIQRKIGRTFKAYDEANAFVTSVFLEGIGGLVFAIGLSMQHENAWYMATAVPPIIEAIARRVKSEGNTGKHQKPVGMLLPKLLLWPLEGQLGDTRRELKTVELTLPRQQAEYVKVAGPHDFYKTVCALQVPVEREQNLTWSTANHNQFGQKFIKYVASTVKPSTHGLSTRIYDGNSIAEPITKKAKEDPKEKINVSIDLDRKHQAVIYTHSLPVGQYQKTSSLICRNGERYIVTTIGTGTGQESKVMMDSKALMDKTLDILAESTALDARVKKIAEETGARYLHLQRFEAGKQTHEYQYTV